MAGMVIDDLQRQRVPDHIVINLVLTKPSLTRHALPNGLRIWHVLSGSGQVS